MNNQIEIISTENTFKISQTKSGLIKSWFFNIFITLILNSVIVWVLYIIQKSTFTLSSILINLLFFAIYMFILRKFRRKVYVEINKTNDEFCINNKIFFKKENINSLVFKKFFGELNSKGGGHLFIKIKNKKYLICYSITINEFDRLKKLLILFFGIDIIINTIPS